MGAGFGTRGFAAVAALFLLLAGGATQASAEVQPSILPIAKAYDLGAPTGPASPAPTIPITVPLAVPRAPAIATLTPPGAGRPIVVPQPFGASTILPVVSTLPLSALVEANSVGDLDEEATCLATAVYFESKGEPLEGQLAVAHVVMNRAGSGRYPASLCGVVRQRAQFSFVRRGSFPRIDPACAAWRKARAIARVAQLKLAPAMPSDVLWYHADYVAPRWRQTLTRFEKVGRHIFYRV